MKNWHISRRRMLKGLGASVALPLLEAMAPPGMDSLKYFERNRPKRFSVFYLPNGVREDYWTPSQTGRNFTISPTLQPLSSFKNDMLILGQLRNNLVDTTGSDAHYAKTAPFLTCMPITKTTGSDINVNGTSFDQVISKYIGRDTRFNSLEYGLEPVKGGVDEVVGYTRLYGAAISWEGPRQPRVNENNPRFAFDRLFRNVIPGKTPKKENPWKRSVLDIVREDTKRLNKVLGAADQNKIGEYLASIRSVEKMIESPEDFRDFEAKITPDIKKELIRLDVRLDDYVDVNSGKDITEKARLMLDINALALWSDATRVSTFMFGNSVSNRNFSFLEGVEGGHHSTSHHKGHSQRIEMYGRINLWHTKQVAYFVNKMKSIQEGDHSLLDSSVILYGSSLRDGDTHSPTDLPLVLIGNGCGRLNTGQNLQFPEKTPLANLYLSLLKSMDIDLDSFGDSTGILPGILV